MFAYIYSTPIGDLLLGENEGFLTYCSFGSSIPVGYIKKETAVLQEAVSQMLEYFRGNRKEFSLPLKPEGTAFQQKVWNALQTIPYGQTKSYLEIANQIGNPKACRAVGMANHNNPIAIIIPCHRVVGKNGSLTGYAGGLNIKQYLLNLEYLNK